MSKSGTPIPDQLNDISCSWSEKEQRYISLAEKWRRNHMTWAQLKKLLDNMAEIKHSAMDDGVECLVDGVRYDMQLFENLVDGRVVLIPSFVEEDDVD